MSETKTKIFVYLNSANAEWLDEAVAFQKRNRRRTNRSELIDLAVSSLKARSQDEIKRSLQKRPRSK